MTMFVKPKPGGLVRQPERKFQPLPAEGKLVPKSPYWIRRLRAGDVVEAKEEKPKPAEKTPEKGFSKSEGK